MSSVVAQVLPARPCCNHSPHAQDVVGAHVATSTALAQARRDLQYAVMMGTDTHRRRQYALSARDEAATVPVAGDATAAQLRYARHYLMLRNGSPPRRTAVWCSARQQRECGMAQRATPARSADRGPESESQK